MALKLIFSALFTTMVSVVCFGQFIDTGTKSHTNDSIGIRVTNPVAPLDVNGPIHSNGTTVLYNGTPASDAFRIGWTNDFLNQSGRDYLLFEKIDANDATPDGGIAFLNTGSNGVQKVSMAILGDGKVGVGTATPAVKMETREDRNDDYTYSMVRNDGNGGAGLWVHNGSNTSTGSSKVIFRNSNAALNGPEYWAMGNDRTDGNKFKLHFSNDMRGASTFVFDRSGRFGIGTNSPQGALHILKSGAPPSSLPAAQNGLMLGTQSTSGYKWMQSYGGMLALNPMGNSVGVGTTKVPAGYLFAVKGKLICEEVFVQLYASWPDYVFKPDYQLLPLEQVAQSIQQNGHLPGIPSAVEVEAKGGIELGEMQRLQTQKIEELFLYILDLKRENDQLKKDVQTLLNR